MKINTIQIRKEVQPKSIPLQIDESLIKDRNLSCMWLKQLGTTNSGICDVI